MGVKDLWTILSPICERKPLWEFEDSCIAIDLSCWICDSQNVTDNHAQPNMYLRNLFFRTTYLLLQGILPIFVLEGEAPELKHAAIEHRKNVRQKTVRGSKPPDSNPAWDIKKGNRSRLKGIQNQCAELFTIMGVPFMRSVGEAEALCAQLNQIKVADGVISEDSDCFLYGARTVYRNFNLSNNAGASVDVYQLHTIEEKLQLGRNKMIALSLLLGCDYQGKGVHGIGKESAIKFLENLEDAEILQRLRDWRENEFLNAAEKDKKFLSSNPSLKLEVKIRQKALEDPSFPSSEIIAEFLKENENLNHHKFCWGQPHLSKFVSLAVRKLKWEENYAIEKFLPVLTRWHLLHGDPEKPIVELEKIVKKRKPRGIASYEILWKSFTITTIEPEAYVNKMYEKAVLQYEELNTKGSKKKQPSKKGKVLGDISNKASAVEASQSKKTRAKGSKKGDTDKGIQTLDKFLVKLNNLSLIDGMENNSSEDINEAKKLNKTADSLQFEDFNAYNDANDYYLENNECEPYRLGQENSFTEYNFPREERKSLKDATHRDTNSSNSGRKLPNFPLKNCNSDGLLTESELLFSEKYDQSQMVNDVSMLSFDFDHENLDTYYYDSYEHEKCRFDEENFPLDNNLNNDVCNFSKDVSHQVSSSVLKKLSVHSKAQKLQSSKKHEILSPKNVNELQTMNVSMHSCDHDSPEINTKTNSLSQFNNHSCMDFSPMRTLNFEFNDENEPGNQSLRTENMFDQCWPKISTPLPKSNQSDIDLKFETPNSGKKTWVSKFQQKCKVDESITASDFECEADDISDLSEIVESIVNRQKH